MRIIGEIPHPQCKITVFKMEYRFTVKFETGMYEQSYKFRVGDGLDNFEHIQALIDAPFIEVVMERFRVMRDDAEAVMGRYFHALGPVEEEEEII